jgi:hypothetical protein
MSQDELFWGKWNVLLTSLFKKSCQILENEKKKKLSSVVAEMSQLCRVTVFDLRQFHLLGVITPHSWWWSLCDDVAEDSPEHGAELSTSFILSGQAPRHSTDGESELRVTHSFWPWTIYLTWNGWWPDNSTLACCLHFCYVFLVRGENETQ